MNKCVQTVFWISIVVINVKSFKIMGKVKGQSGLLIYGVK
jgi:hypothetical protein